ncbi:MICAL-like protein 2a [Sardina pilchardus]|uniref:MICAL-like protein 2a n=1 Tax=Sardina pilchardus TaxID=27697 RepID=UPI002E14E421
MAAIKALQQWCKNQCDGYTNVAVTNMTTSFRDGLAFCALIHKYRPDLINYESLRKENIYENNKLAFHVAEEHLGIPALLDAEDMVALSIPDRLSILTYVSQYYNYFNGRSPIGGVGGVKRPAEDSKEEPSEKKNLPVVSKVFGPKRAIENCPPTPLIQKPSPQLKPEPAAQQKAVLVESSNKTGTLNSKCAVCKTHVHLVQRHLVDGKLYHRSCFKCSECSNPLLPGAYKTGAEPGTFICNAHQKGYKSSLPRAAQKSTSGPVKPPTTPAAPAAPATPAVQVQVPKKDDKTQPAVPKTSSMLAAPVKVTLRPVEPSPAPQPWTPSAQRTQAARRQFFQSSTQAPSSAPAPTLSSTQAPSSAPSKAPAPTPSSVLFKAPAPAVTLSSTQTPSSAPPKASAPSSVSAPTLSSAHALRESVAHRPAPGPTEAGTTPSRAASKPEEKERARALISRKLAEGNCNNNNIAYQFGSRTEQNWSGKGLRSAGAPSWRLEKRSQGTAGGGAAPAHPSSTTSTSTSTIPIPTLTPIPTPMPAITQHIAASDVSAADWRSKLQPSSNGPSLKSPGPAKGCPPNPVENKPTMTYKASLCITVTSTSSDKPQPLTSPPSSGSSSSRPPSVQQPRRKSSGGHGDGVKALAESASSTQTVVVSRSSSASNPSRVKASSPKQRRRGSAGFGSQNESYHAQSPSTGLSGWTTPVSSSVQLQPYRAPSPKQPFRGSAGAAGSRNGYSTSTGPTPRWVTPVTLHVSPSEATGLTPHWVTPVTVRLSPSESTNHKTPSAYHTPHIVPVEQGSTNGHHSEEMAFVATVRSPAKTHHIPMDEIVKELGEIEENLNELEREGVDLEKRLRSCEEEGRGDLLMDPLMVDWFNLIRKKQGYMRRESELVYIARTQDLEEQQPGVEGQLRRLLDKPEHLKSESERRQQSELMERLLEIINDRNAIVEGLDQDRLREEEEDQQLNEMMQKLGMKKTKSKRQSSFSKLFRRKSKRVVAEG